jgi:hypothetical protein
LASVIEAFNLIHLRLGKGALATGLLLKRNVFLGKRVLDLAV